MVDLTLQLHVHGAWRDLADISVLEPDKGVRGATRFAYRDEAFFDLAVMDFADGVPVRDYRAASVRLPLTLDPIGLPTWPAFLVDMMPQGKGRQKIARRLGLRPDTPEAELPILMQCAGAPVGNLRLLEAHEMERDRLAGTTCRPLSDKDLETRSDDLVDLIERFCPQWASGASAQGEWPKALLTRNRAGDWLPDPLVSDEDAVEHVIVKLLKSSADADRTILEAEAAYLETARWFGVNVAQPLRWHGQGSLIIPRFDRGRSADSRLLRHGQESLFSALGVADNARGLRHETCLRLLDEVAEGDPAAEYLRRDVLNHVMGNPDNHGRNTALRKEATGGVALSPLFDFAPMSLADDRPARGTRWACLNGRDFEPGWIEICTAVARGDVVEAARLRDVMTAMLPRLETLRDASLDLGVRREVVEGPAFRMLDTTITAIAELGDWDPARTMEETNDAADHPDGP